MGAAPCRAPYTTTAIALERVLRVPLSLYWPASLWCARGVSVLWRRWGSPRRLGMCACERGCDSKSQITLNACSGTFLIRTRISGLKQLREQTTKCWVVPSDDGGGWVTGISVKGFVCMLFSVICFYVDKACGGHALIILFHNPPGELAMSTE